MTQSCLMRRMMEPRIWLPRCGTCTLGRIKNRVLLVMKLIFSARVFLSHPIKESRGAVCQAAEPKRRQAISCPDLSRTRYLIFSPFKFGSNEFLWERGTRLAPAGNTYRRQIDKTPLLKLVDHASSSKGFELSGMGVPPPVIADMFGYSMPTPAWMVSNYIE